MNPRATSRWGRVLVDALMLYVLYTLGIGWTMITIIGVLIAVNTYLEFKARAMEE
jgi:hypothetical protein